MYTTGSVTQVDSSSMSYKGIGNTPLESGPRKELTAGVHTQSLTRTPANEVVNPTDGDAQGHVQKLVERSLPRPPALELLQNPIRSPRKRTADEANEDRIEDCTQAGAGHHRDYFGDGSAIDICLCQPSSNAQRIPRPRNGEFARLFFVLNADTVFAPCSLFPGPAK